MACIERLKELEQLYLKGVKNGKGCSLSFETLLDSMIVLYDECCSSTLRREKSVSDFVEFGKYGLCLRTYKFQLIYPRHVHLKCN